MIFKDRLEPIGPALARGPLDQPFECMLAGHVPARVMEIQIAASNATAPQVSKRTPSVRSGTGSFG
jgi:hypothetical protein